MPIRLQRDQLEQRAEHDLEQGTVALDQVVEQHTLARVTHGRVPMVNAGRREDHAQEQREAHSSKVPQHAERRA